MQEKPIKQQLREAEEEVEDLLAKLSQRGIYIFRINLIGSDRSEVDMVIDNERTTDV